MGRTTVPLCINNFMANHQVGDVLNRRLTCWSATDHVPIAKDGKVITHLHHFF